MTNFLEKKAGYFVAETVRWLLISMIWLFLVLVSVVLSGTASAESQTDETTFSIRSFTVIGNTLLRDEAMATVLDPFIGSERTAADVEKARGTLEAFYHQQGYPTVLVNIPEQTVDEGVVALDVIESRIRKVKVSGNRYFTRAKILEALPSLRPDEVLYLPAVQQELVTLNSNPDLKVAPILMPGRDLGAIDVELKVKDKIPIHGNLEVNNRSTHDTTELRLNASIRYDNLWQRDHSVSLQYQTSPQDLNEVQVVAGSYVFPAPWERQHLIALYAVYSDSDTATGDALQVVGKGNILGMRYVMPLPSYESYMQSLVLGIDYKDFEEDAGFQDENEPIQTPVTYLPLSVHYNSSLAGSSGVTRFSGGLNTVFRGLVTDRDEFEDKRFKARGNYIYATAGVERTQNLPKGFSLFAKLDGQLADQPLISNEQYSAGGVESVRGYKETEALGDNAIHWVLEVSSPELVSRLGASGKHKFNLYTFYEGAWLEIKDPLPGEDEQQRLNGVGAGLRGSVYGNIEWDLSWGVALSDTDRTEAGDQRLYFMVKWGF